MMLLFRRLAVLSIAVFCAVAYSSQPDSYSPLRAEPALSLAVISDTHIESTEPQKLAATCGVFADVAAAERNDSLVIVGDSVMNGQEIENLCLYGALRSARLTSKLFIASGNHELGNGGSEAGFNSLTKRYIGFRNAFTPDKTDKVYYSTELNGFRLIALGSEADAGVQAYLSEAQLSWLDRQLTDAGGQPVFVFCHQPVDGTFNYAWGEGHVGEQGDALKKILQEHENVFYISGHLHMGYTQGGAYTESGVTYINVPCCAGSLYGEEVSPGCGYVIEVYKTEVCLRARNFGSSQWLTEYDFVFPINTSNQ